MTDIINTVEQAVNEVIPPQAQASLVTIAAQVAEEAAARILGLSEEQVMLAFNIVQHLIFNRNTAK